MIHPLLLQVRSLRQALLGRALHQQAPPPDVAKKLIDLVPQFARMELDDVQLAHLWGELQIILVECEGRREDATAWGQVRNAADAGLVGVLKRKEWDELQELFRRDIFSRLASAVLAPRDARMQACIEATTRLRQLALRPAGHPWHWRLLQIAEMQYPRFGTSGWRARMGVDFSWRRATAVTQAILDYLQESGLHDRPLTIGYDSRVNADRVANLVAEIAVANGMQVLLAVRETPSPALIHYITETLGVAKNAGLINCTPSHNPVRDPATGLYLGTEYHGIRYNMPYGGVAPSRATDTIGLRAMELLLEDTIVPVDRPRGKVTLFDPMPAYTVAVQDDLSGKVAVPENPAADALTQIRNFWGAEDAVVVIDEMHSASRGYLRVVCDALGIRYELLHEEKNPLLGELMYANPEPPHIAGCAAKVRELKKTHPRIIGLGFDTDSDRFGVVDEHGNYFMMNRLLPLLADYLLTTAYNGQPGKIIRNNVTTRLLDRVAAENREKIIPPADPSEIVLHASSSAYQVVLGDPGKMSGFLTFVVPVGFKYIADVMMDKLQEALAAGGQSPDRIQQVFHECLQRLLLAGEESNGMTSRGHTPDKDGLWGALLTLQMCAVRRKPLGALWDDFVAKYGKLVSARRDVEAPDVAKEGLVDAYLDRYADMAEQGVIPDPLLADFTPIYCGGVRGGMVEIILHDADERECYLTIRASGTEPLNRIYVECPEEGQREELLRAVGEELERGIVSAIVTAHDVNTVVDLLTAVELPPAEGGDLPATYTNRIIGPAIARIREIGNGQGDEMVLLADRELGERNPAKAGSLTSVEPY
ncbi:MAG: phosphohexomutase domain-containing protein [Armatimonadota bacterium]